MSAIDSRAREAVRGLKPYVPGTPIDEVKKKLGLKSVIKLASNENALGPSPKAVAALKAAAASLHRYPDAGGTLLRAALAKKLRVPADRLVLGNGSDELLVLALRAFVDPGDEVIVAKPTFLIYELQARASGAEVTVIPLKNYRYDLNAMRAAVTSQTKLIFIANPDNPTGSYVTTKELWGFLEALPRHVVVVVDEAYYEYVDAKNYPQTIGWIDRFPVLVTRTFSKAYGLAGLRIGYGISQPSISAALHAVREPFNVNSLAQAAALAALDDQAFIRKAQKMNRDGQRYVEREMVRLGLRTVPSAANFLLVQAGPKAQDVAQRLLKQGVIVREMSGWALDGFLRVTIGTRHENERFVKALKKALTGR